MTPESMLLVIQAHIDGKVVQFKHLGEWEKTAFEPEVWDFVGMEYRIKPEPEVIYMSKRPATTCGLYYWATCNKSDDGAVKFIQVLDDE